MLQLDEYLQELQWADTKDEKLFQRLINRGIILLELEDGDFTKAFACSRPTIERWKNGVNAPHPAMRKPIYDWLEKKTLAMQLKCMSKNTMSKELTLQSIVGKAAAAFEARYPGKDPSDTYLKELAILDEVSNINDYIFAFKVELTLLRTYNNKQLQLNLK